MSGRICDKVLYHGTNIVGKVFSRLTIVGCVDEKTDITVRDKVYCKCSCGNYCEVIYHTLTEGRTKSCGCLKKESNKKKGKKNGERSAIDYRREFENGIYGNFQFLGPTKERSGNCVMWKVKCLREKDNGETCGNEFCICPKSIFSGCTQSCGCLQKDKNLIQHPFYSRRGSIINRCYNENDKGYKNYGGRGIIVQDSWLNNGQEFMDAMVHQMHKQGLTYKDIDRMGYHFDRKNNDGNYEEGNIQWSLPPDSNGNRDREEYKPMMEEWKRQQAELCSSKGYSRDKEDWKTLDVNMWYEVSTFGRVREKLEGIKILSTSNGYYMFGNESLHVLLYKTFLGPIEEGLLICHLNDVRTDNNIFNLFKGTHAENMIMCCHNGSNKRKAKEAAEVSSTTL